jgi:hypothetical protein
MKRAEGVLHVLLPTDQASENEMTSHGCFFDSLCEAFGSPAISIRQASFVEICDFAPPLHSGLAVSMHSAPNFFWLLGSLLTSFRCNAYSIDSRFSSCFCQHPL